MGVQLDWRIDADNKPNQQKHAEDKAQRQQRQRRFLKFLLFLSVLLGMGLAIVLFVFQRLEDANTQLENLLADTVRAEVASLRIGDSEAFLSLQRSASADWLLAQEVEFNRYQALKTSADLQLTGRVDNVTISGQRGRVQVEEIIDGVPYLRTWFYWRYDADVINDVEVPAGWYRVPPDFTFWGQSTEKTSDHVTIRYQALDETFAQPLNDALTNWLGLLCDLVICADLPPFTIDIVPNNMPEPIWTTELNQWQMIIPSPYVGRARADMPFDMENRFPVATLLAERFVHHFTPSPQYPTDAFYLRSAIVSWFVGHFVQIDTNSFLIASLHNHYGAEALADLLQRLRADSSMAIMTEVIPTPLDQANIDWRDLLTWRLVTERDLINRNDQTAFLSLYDMRLPDTASLAYDRFATRNALENPIVVHAERATASDGTPQLRAIVQTADGSEHTVLFHLVNNTWLRAN